MKHVSEEQHRLAAEAVKRAADVCDELGHRRTDEQKGEFDQAIFDYASIVSDRIVAELMPLHYQMAMRVLGDLVGMAGEDICGAELEALEVELKPKPETLIERRLVEIETAFKAFHTPYAHDVAWLIEYVRRMAR